MTREELREVIRRVLEKMKSEGRRTAAPACLFGDEEPCASSDVIEPCDMTTYYGVGEED